MDVHGATLLPSVTTKEMLTVVTYIKLVIPPVLNTVNKLVLAVLFAMLYKDVSGVVIRNLVRMRMLLFARDKEVVRSANLTDIVTLVWTKKDVTGVKDLNPLAPLNLALLESLKLMTVCLTAMV